LLHCCISTVFIPCNISWNSWRWMGEGVGGFLKFSSSSSETIYSAQRSEGGGRRTLSPHPRSYKYVVSPYSVLRITFYITHTLPSMKQSPYLFFRYRQHMFIASLVY